jgi:hypothetical protein
VAPDLARAGGAWRPAAAEQGGDDALGRARVAQAVAELRDEGRRQQHARWHGRASGCGQSARLSGARAQRRGERGEGMGMRVVAQSTKSVESVSREKRAELWKAWKSAKVPSRVAESR